MVVWPFFSIFVPENGTTYMNSRIIRILFFTLGLLLSADVFAIKDPVFYVYNAANGLADNSAQTINCTKTGRLVITTMGQINFYDGQQFTYIDPTTENTYPLSKYNGHAHLYFDKHHHLWLKRRHSLTCVNLTQEVFVKSIVEEFQKLGMDDQVEDLFVDDNNNVWLLTAKGLYNCETKQTYQVRPKLNLQELKTWQDKYLLLFYENGLLDVLELSSGTPVYSEKAYDESLSAKYSGTSLVRMIGDMFYQIRNGNSNGILLRFDVNKWEWDTILETPYYLSNVVEQDSTIYIPSAYGYWTYDMASGALEHTEQLKMSNGQMLLTDINAIEFDRQGGMWVGTEKRGLLYARPYSSPFKVYSWSDQMALDLARLMDEYVTVQDKYRDKSVNCVFKDSRGWDWVGTSTGLQLYRNESAHLPQLITRNEGLTNNVIHTIVEDNDGHIWVGTSFGINCLVIEDGKIRFINRYNQWDGVPNESFVNGRALLMDDGSIAMQALDHVVMFNPDEMSTVTGKVLFDIYPKLVRLFVNGNDLRTGDKLDGKVILERALTRTKEINLNYNQNSVSLTFSALNYFRPQQTYYRVRVNGPGMENRWKVFTPYDAQGFVDRSGQLHLPLVALRPGTYKIEVQSSMLPDEWSSTPYEWIVNVNEPWWRTTGVFALIGLVLFFLLIIYLFLYLRNANMRARRNSEEQGILKRIRSFVERCQPNGSLLLEPIPDEIVASEHFSMNEFSPEFIQSITAIMPLMLKEGKKHVSMRELSSVSNKSLQEFYGLMSSNIYKNPRPIKIQLMLDRAAEMLADKSKDIAEVAEACDFVTPNYFIASFFHRYQQTPEEYREKQ